jgi:hypothetical protein
MKILFTVLLSASLFGSDYIIDVESSTPVYARGYDEVKIGTTPTFNNGSFTQSPVYMRLETPQKIGYKSCGRIGYEEVCTFTKERVESFDVSDRQLNRSYNRYDVHTVERDRSINYYSKPLSDKLGIKTRRWW